MSGNDIYNGNNGFEELPDTSNQEHKGYQEEKVKPAHAETGKGNHNMPQSESKEKDKSTNGVIVDLSPVKAELAEIKNANQSAIAGLDNVNNALNDARKEVIHKVGDVEAELITLETNVIKSVNETKGEVDGIKTQLNTISKDVHYNIDCTKDVITKTIYSNGDKINTNINSVKEKIGNNIDSAKDKINSSIKSSTQDIVDSISSSQKLVQQTVSDKVSSQLKELKNNLMTDVKSAVSSTVVTSVKSGIDNHSQEIADSISSKLNSTALLNIYSLSTTTNKLTDKTDDLSSKTDNLLSKISTLTYEIGQVQKDGNRRTTYIISTIIFVVFSILSGIFAAQGYVRVFENTDLLRAAVSFVVLSVIIAFVFAFIYAANGTFNENEWIGFYATYCIVEFIFNAIAFGLSIHVWLSC